MAKDQSEIMQQLTSRFIELANTMKDEEVSPEMVSAALMSASGFYATYVAAGNDGGLNASGVEKVAEAYKDNLHKIQQYKKDQAANQA